MLKLYSYRRCPFAMRVRLTLEEKGIPYHVIEENLSQLSSELSSLHPEARVPLLLVDQEPIYESYIITEYLEDQYTPPSHPSLMPNTAIEKSKVRMWTYWCDDLFKPDLDLFKYELKNLTSPERDELLQRLHSKLSTLNESLSKSQYLLGDQLTLADVHIFPFFRQLRRIQPEIPEIEKYTHANRWYLEINERPSFKRAMEKK